MQITGHFSISKRKEARTLTVEAVSYMCAAAASAAFAAAEQTNEQNQLNQSVAWKFFDDV